MGAGGRSVVRKGLVLALVAAVASSVSLLAREDADARPAQRTGAPSTTRVPNPDEFGDFVSVARSTFPELDDDEADCIARGTLPRLSTEVIVTLLMDRDAPLKTTAAQREVLEATIDECVPRSTAVEVIARHLSGLAARDATIVLSDGDLSFSDLQCIDDELGAIGVGSTFFDLYTAPLGFQEQLAGVALECVDLELQQTWLRRWIDTSGVVLPSPWEGPGRSDPMTLAAPSPARDCLLAVLVDIDDRQVPDLLEQVLLSASAAALDDRLDDLASWFATCAQPVPRGSGS